MLKQKPLPRSSNNVPVQLKIATQKFSETYIIISPPRCSSTALSRVFWEHPAITHYCHEPFENVYYQDADISQVVENIDEALELQLVKRTQRNNSEPRLLIKEMPYQVGRYFADLTAVSTAPITFLIRDPRLNIASRIEKKLEKGQDPNFPLIETGWELLQTHVSWCEANDKPYRIVDSTQFRTRPELVLGKLFRALSLEFEPSLIEWESRPTVCLDNLAGEHEHLYRRVLSSTKLEPPSEPIPELSTFPTTNGMREHVANCLEIYRALRSSDSFIDAL